MNNTVRKSVFSGDANVLSLMVSLVLLNPLTFIYLTDLKLQSKLLSQNNKSLIRLIKRDLLSWSVLFCILIISSQGNLLVVLYLC